MRQAFNAATHWLGYRHNKCRNSHCKAAKRSSDSYEMFCAKGAVQLCALLFLNIKLNFRVLQKNMQNGIQRAALHLNTIRKTRYDTRFLQSRKNGRKASIRSFCLISMKRHTTRMACRTNFGSAFNQPASLKPKILCSPELQFLKRSLSISKRVCKPNSQMKSHIKRENISPVCYMFLFICLMMVNWFYTFLARAL